MQRIGSCLWFDGQAEEAANFYVSIFKNSRIVRTSRYLEGTPGPVGTVMAVEFILDAAVTVKIAVAVTEPVAETTES